MADTSFTDPNTWVHFDVSSISLALVVLGTYVCLIGQLSFWIKERLFMSSALISICIGIAVGPIGLNWLSPWKWTDYNETQMNNLTYQLCRLVIGIQVMFAGISLPAAYLKREWQSLFILLLPIMTIAWFVSAGLILAFVPSLTFLEALCISACVTPTDPILANAIVKGRYAEKHVPHNVRNIISAESGANDGLGYPFIFLPIFLMKRGQGSVASALQHWVVETWIYEILLACALGAVIGYVARKTLKEAHKRKLVDHESFLAYGIGLAFLTLGVAGILGTDDVLAAFIAGNSLTWKDFYRIESEDDTFQDVIDNLLNASIFIYLGTLLPWSDFGDASLPLSPWKLVLLAITILLVRRLPWVMLLSPVTPSLHDKKQALFAGWFGPIGVSAVYYAMVAERELPLERDHLRKVIVPVVLFIALASTVTHGVTIPLTKFAPLAITHTRSFSSFVGTRSGHYIQRLRTSDISGPLPRTSSTAVSSIFDGEHAARIEALSKMEIGQSDLTGFGVGGGDEHTGDMGILRSQANSVVGLPAANTHIQFRDSTGGSSA